MKSTQTIENIPNFISNNDLYIGYTFPVTYYSTSTGQLELNYE